ncbi:hypothetical protein AB6E06_25295 [Vibrio splendidus]
MFFSKKEKVIDSLMNRVSSVTSTGEYMVLASALVSILNDKSNDIVERATLELNGDHAISAYAFASTEQKKVVFKNHATRNSLEFPLPYDCNYRNYRYMEEMQNDLIERVQTIL